MEQPPEIRILVEDDDMGSDDDSGSIIMSIVSGDIFSDDADDDTRYDTVAKLKASNQKSLCITISIMFYHQ